MIDTAPVRSLDPVLSVRFCLATFPEPPRSKPTDHARAFAGHPCPLCGTRLSPDTVRWSWIVPRAHEAAPATGHGDRFAICADCANRRGTADILDGPLAHPGDLLDRRRMLLRAGAHHPTRWCDRMRIASAIAARVAQPRVALAATITTAGAAVIGWSERSGSASALGALVHLLRAAYPVSRIDDDSDAPAVVIGASRASAPLLWRVAAPHGLNALWTLIDAGALLRAARPTQVDAADWRTAWYVRWYSMRQHVERLDEHLWPVPMPPRVHAQGAGARRMRALRAMRA